jgi:hypothetical protein
MQGKLGLPPKLRRPGKLIAFPSCLLIDQKFDNATHVFSQSFQFLFSKIVYKPCVSELFQFLYSKSVYKWCVFLVIPRNEPWQNEPRANELVPKRTQAKRTASEMSPGASNRERNEPSPSADFQGDHNRSAKSRNVCSCMAFPTCLLIVQRADDTNHVFSQLFQFLYNKIVYKQCVSPVVTVIQGFRNYGKSVSGTFLKPWNSWNN